MVTCPLTNLEAQSAADALEGMLTMTGQIRRPAPAPAPWTKVATIPCYLTLTSGAVQESVTTPGHQDRVNAELLTTRSTDLRVNDTVIVNSAMFTVRVIDPDDTVLLRALGRVEH